MSGAPGHSERCDLPRRLNAELESPPVVLIPSGANKHECAVVASGQPDLRERASDGHDFRDHRRTGSRVKDAEPGKLGLVEMSPANRSSQLRELVPVAIENLFLDLPYQCRSSCSIALPQLIEQRQKFLPTMAMTSLFRTTAAPAGATAVVWVGARL